MNIRLISAAAVAIVGVGVLVWSQRPPQDRRVADAPASVSLDAERLKAASLGKPRDSSDVDELVDDFAAHLADAIARLPAEHALDPPAARRLVEVARERLDLYLDPDFDRYAAHSRSLLASAGQTAPDRWSPLTREEWAKHAEDMRLAPIDTRSVMVRAMFIRGRRLADFTWEGGYTEMMNLSNFFPVPRESRDGKKLDEDSDIYLVMVPVETRDALTDAPVRVFLAMTFARRPGGAVWLSWRVGLNDPSNNAILVPPWL